MGSSGSKAARTAAATATRKYPSRAAGQAPAAATSAPPPPASSAPTPGAAPGGQAQFESQQDSAQAGPTVYTKAQPSDRRTEGIDEPLFAAAHSCTLINHIILAEIDLDARDPHFANRLTTLGPVKPYPTFSPSSTSTPFPPPTNPTSSSSRPSESVGSDAPFGPGVFPSPANNPAIATLTARSRIQDAVEQEKVDAGRRGFEGRQYLDIVTVRKVLTLRDEQGMKAEDIEKALRLKKGVVAGLGRVGVLEAA